jgi:lipoprotein-anchoring transpeptidase ErfK/SrfK
VLFSFNTCQFSYYNHGIENPWSSKIFLLSSHPSWSFRMVRRAFFVFVVLVIAFTHTADAALAEKIDASQREIATNIGDADLEAAGRVDTASAADDFPLCLPSHDLLVMSDCLVAGPTRVISEYAAKGWTFPPRPIPGRVPDRSLAQVPFAYAHVRNDFAPVFASLEAAADGAPVLRNLPLGFQYVTYIQTAEVDGKRYYMVDPGIWMRGEDLSRIATGSYQGLAFDRTPAFTVGWARNQVDVMRSPGYRSARVTGRVLYRYDAVQIFDTQTVDNMDWYMIRPGEWVEGRQISRVLVNTTPPDGVTNDRWIEINLAEQTLAVYEKRKLVFASLIATGVPGFWTRPGLFQIYQKKEAETMQGSFTADRSDFYRLEDVPWTMYFDKARALHGAYWHNRFGFPVSHGCVNLSPGDANWLFSWAEEGDWVYVWDPTGETPTDPRLYGDGGA